LILRNKNDAFLGRIVTCDEKWILYENRRVSAQWWSAAELIHYGLLIPGETITAEKDCQQIDEVHRKNQQQRPALLNRRGPNLLHDNARHCVVEPALQKKNKLGYGTLPHPPYLSDLSPTGYHF
ncbi:hypothetical protein Angca_004273, partial [Angiostrongylus cantonensis]